MKTDNEKLREKAHEKFKEEASNYFKEHFAKNAKKIKSRDKCQKEDFTKSMQDSGDVFRKMFEETMKKISVEHADLVIAKRIEEKNKKQTLAHINESAKEKGREMSQKQLNSIMKEYSRRHLDKDINAIVQDRLKKDIKSQVDEKLREYANSCVQSRIEIQSLEKYVEDRTEEFVIETVGNMAPNAANNKKR